jgi:hypothetical protein
MANQSPEKLARMLQVADAVNPPMMRKNKYFVMVDDRVARELFPGSGNKFLKFSEITETGIASLIGRDVVVGLRESAAEVLIMLYKEDWENNNFYLPMMQVIRYLRRIMNIPEPGSCDACRVA